MSVVPRAHDCCTILLGSKSQFKKHFESCPSQPFCSRGHVERGSNGHVHHVWMQPARSRRELLAKLYGEGNADHLAKALAGPDTGKLVYVNLKPTQSNECIELCRETAKADNREYIQIEGTLLLLQNLTSGNWHATDFLVVRPEQRIRGVYDWDTVMEAVEDEPNRLA